MTRPTTLGQLLRSTALRYQTPARWAGGPRRLRDSSRFLEALPPLYDDEVPPIADDRVAKLARLEAALFLAREPMSTRKLANLAKLADGTETRTLAKLLNKRYEQVGSAIEVVDVAGGIQLLTRAQLADWIARLHGGLPEMRLSAPAMETLSVVAYQQPVVRAEIEAIRGVQCGEILRVLMERDLLRIVGRADELGRPFLYGTTKKFLQFFGLRRMEDLPTIDQIRNVEMSC